jgi:hypothetical protein
MKSTEVTSVVTQPPSNEDSVLESSMSKTAQRPKSRHSSTRIKERGGTWGPQSRQQNDREYPQTESLERVPDYSAIGCHPLQARQVRVQCHAASLRL